MKYTKLIFTFWLSFLFLTSCGRPSDSIGSSETVQPVDSIYEANEDYESRGRVLDSATFQDEAGNEIITLEEAQFTLPEGWNAEVIYFRGADIELENQREGSIMDLWIRANVKPSANDAERLKSIPELASGEWYELPCGLGAWCYYVTLRDTWYSFVYGVDYVEEWELLEKDLYQFFNSIEVIAYTSAENKLNTEVFDERFDSLEAYFALTDFSEYSAGYISNNISPEAYTLIRNEQGEANTFFMDASQAGSSPFFWIYAEEGYEDKDEAPFYLRRIQGPKDELYGPFFGNLETLLK